jgi:cellobiose phosphorylase
MNAGRNAAKTFDEGLRLSISNNEAQTFVVDFYNVVSQNIPIEVALAINLQQSLDARNHYVEYQVMKGQLAMAQTVADVRSVPLNFSINILP